LKVDWNEMSQVAEFAALIDAIPREFREPILLAALVAVRDNMASEPFVVGLRSRFVECVRLSTGISLTQDQVCSAECIEVREVIAMIADSNALTWTETLVSQLIHTTAGNASRAGKASE
jgi:hypothetical protein